MSNIIWTNTKFETCPQKLAKSLPKFASISSKEIHVMSTDRALIQQTLEGDARAFGDLVQKYQALVYAQALRQVHNPQDAEELTQDVFLKAYQNLAQLRDADCFASWLKRIAANECASWLRQHWEARHACEEDADLLLELPSQDAAPDQALIQRELRQAILQAIDSLPPLDRSVARSFYIDQLSYEEISAQHGLSQSAIASRLHKAKHRIAQKVKQSLGAFGWLGQRWETLFLGGTKTMPVILMKTITWIATASVVGFGTTPLFNSWFDRLTEEQDKGIILTFLDSEPEKTAADKPKIEPKQTEKGEAEKHPTAQKQEGKATKEHTQDEVKVNAHERTLERRELKGDALTFRFTLSPAIESQLKGFMIPIQPLGRVNTVSFEYLPEKSATVFTYTFVGEGQMKGSQVFSLPQPWLQPDPVPNPIEPEEFDAEITRLSEEITSALSSEEIEQLSTEIAELAKATVMMSAEELEKLNAEVVQLAQEAGKLSAEELEKLNAEVAQMAQEGQGQMSEQRRAKLEEVLRAHRLRMEEIQQRIQQRLKLTGEMKPQIRAKLEDALRTHRLQMERVQDRLKRLQTGEMQKQLKAAQKQMKAAQDVAQVARLKAAKQALAEAAAQMKGNEAEVEASRQALKQATQALEKAIKALEKVKAKETEKSKAKPKEAQESEGTEGKLEGLPDL
jgi:RNA polymerase sigma-70 factor (ECF subfamily)